MKAITLKSLYLGQLIVRGEHEDAQVYTIGAIRGSNVYLVWFEGSRQFGQWDDYHHSYKPTLKQVEYSIAANGRLASGQDIKDLDLL
jgi:hypothetical protein